MALALSRDPGAAERPWQPSTAAVAQAGREGWDELAWDLAGSLAGFLAMRSYFDDLRQTHERALGAVTKAGNRRGRAYMLRGLGHLAIFAGVGDRLGEAHVLSRFGVPDQSLGELERAEAAYRAALAIYERYGDRASAAMNVRRLGELALLRGRRQESRSLLGQALAVLREVGRPLHRGPHPALSGRAGPRRRPPGGGRRGLHPGAPAVPHGRDAGLGGAGAGQLEGALRAPDP